MKLKLLNDMNSKQWLFIVLAVLFVGFCSFTLSDRSNEGSSDNEKIKAKGEQQYYTGIKDVANKSIGVMLGSTHDQFVLNNYPNASIFRVDNAPDLLLGLKTGQCDAIVMDEKTGELYMQEEPQLGVLQRDIFKEEYGYGFADAQLRDQFNIYLEEIRASGELEVIINKWSNDDGSATMPEYNFTGTNGTLRIGTTGTDIPFSYVSGTEYIGIDLEILFGFAASHELKPIVHLMPFASMLASIGAKKSDVIGSAITITEERKKQINFSDSYYGSNAIALTLKKNLPPEQQQSNTGLNFTTIEDLKDKRIGVLLGSSQDIFATEHFPDAQIFRMDHSVELSALLEQGQCDAILLNGQNALFMMKEIPEFGCLDNEVTVDYFAFGFPKNKTKERDDFNLFLEEMYASGLYDEIYDRWINHTDEAEMPAIENSGVNGTLKIGSTFEEAPYSFFKDGEYAGFDIEIMMRYAAHLNKKPKFIVFNFSGLLTATSSAKVDVIANAIMITEERNKQIAFSNPYYENRSSMIVLKKNLASYIPDSKESKSWFARVKDSFYNNIIKEKRYMLLWNGLKVTLIISLLSAIFGTLLGALICFMRMSKRKVWRVIAKVYIDLLRGIPQVVLLMLMFYVVFATWNIGGITVAVITFAMNFAAYVSEMFRTAIEGIKKGQTEAGVAMGFSKVKTFLNIIMPQAIQRVVPIYKGEFIALVKMTSIVGYIAVQDLTKASDIIRSRTFDAFFPLIMVAIIYFVLAWLLTLLIDAVQIKVNKR